MTALALSWVILSAFLHALWNAATKSSRSPVEFLFGLEVATTVLGLPILLLADLGSVPNRAWWLLASSAVVHGFYAYFLTRAYESADLGLVYPISRSTPAFVPIPAILLLGERLSWTGVGGIALVLIGIWMVHLSGSAPGKLSGSGLGFAYWTLAATILYSLVDKASMSVLDGAPLGGVVPKAVLWYYLMSAAHLPFFWLLARRRIDLGSVARLMATQPGRMLFATAAAGVSYALILEALRSAPVSYVVAARQSSVVFAVALALLWLREKPESRRMVGAALTVAGVVLIGLA